MSSADKKKMKRLTLGIFGRVLLEGGSSTCWDMFGRFGGLFGEGFSKVLERRSEVEYP